MSLYIVGVKFAPSSAFTSTEKADLIADAKRDPRRYRLFSSG